MPWDKVTKPGLSGPVLRRSQDGGHAELPWQPRSPHEAGADLPDGRCDRAAERRPRVSVVGGGSREDLAPSCPLLTPQGRSAECCVSRQGWVWGARPSERKWLFAGPGCQGVCFDVTRGAVSPSQRDRRHPSRFPAASCLGCVLYAQTTPLPPCFPARPSPGQRHRAQRWGDSMSEALHSHPPEDTGPRDGLWFWAENPAVPGRGPEKGSWVASAAPLLSPVPGGPHSAPGTQGTYPARGPQ